MYIPDMTERFPEGMNGVDMTDSYFPSERSCSNYGGYEPSYEEYVEDQKKENGTVFVVGMQFDTTDIFTGGRHSSIIIERNGNHLICKSVWHEQDSTSKNTEEYDVLTNDQGDEYIILWEYREHQAICYAYECRKAAE